MSAAYATTELQAEFGLLPPAFLPVGGKRLYWWQVQALKKRCARVILTLPESFTLPKRDVALLKALGAEIQFIPDGVSIGQSLLYALNILSLGSTSVAVLHGDTLIRNLPQDSVDAVSLHPTSTAYTWAMIGKSDGLFSDVALQSSSKSQQNVLSGFFAFSDSARLIRALTKENGNFLKALSLYHQTRPLTPQTEGDWLDFGHMQTYQSSKMHMTTERAFNALQVKDNTVSKFSTDHFKMEAEANWFDSIPPALRLYTPPFLGRTSHDTASGYITGYQPISPLNDLFVFGALGRPAWEAILKACAAFIAECKASYDPQQDTSPLPLGDFLAEKTLQRLAQFEAQTGISIKDPLVVNGAATPSLTEIATKSFALISPDSARYRTIMHGDFCFSNIMYDSRNSQVRTIDPRGFLRAGEASIFGDIRYDIAKLYHSAVGKYDFIISGYAQNTQISPTEFTFTLDTAAFGSLAEAAFMETDFAGISPKSDEITAIAVHLFLSMLPLHDDNKDRQISLMLNAVRLFGKLEPSAA